MTGEPCSPDELRTLFLRATRERRITRHPQQAEIDWGQTGRAPYDRTHAEL